MDLPCQFPYRPQWRVILVCFIAPAVVLAVIARTHGIAELFAGFFALFALVLTARRIFLAPFLRLESDALLIPSGFLRLRSTKIPYQEIESVYENTYGTKLFQMAALGLRTKQRNFEIVSTLLPDTASYVAIREFIKSRVIPKEEPVEAGKYGFWCGYVGNGEICNSNGEIIWRFRTLHTRPHYPYGLFRVPDFVVYDKADNELVRVRLQRKWPLARFEMIENGSPICTFQQRSLLRNNFAFAFTSGQKWVFRMPLFTVSFNGVSETGEKIHVHGGRTHNIWYVSIDEKVNRPQLVAALAFIHRERLRFS